MIPTYNGWDETPEEEREELELWERESSVNRRSSQSIPRPDSSFLEGFGGRLNQP